MVFYNETAEADNLNVYRLYFFDLKPAILYRDCFMFHIVSKTSLMTNTFQDAKYPTIKYNYWMRLFRITKVDVSVMSFECHN